MACHIRTVVVRPSNIANYRFVGDMDGISFFDNIKMYVVDCVDRVFFRACCRNYPPTRYLSRPLKTMHPAHSYNTNASMVVFPIITV